MKGLLFSLCCLIGCLIPTLSISQSDLSKYISLNEALLAPHKARYLYVTGDSVSLQKLKLESDKLKNLAGIAVDGKVELENTLWESFSNFKMLEHIILRNNKLTTLKIQSTTTMKELWINGSPDISYEKLNSTLENCIYLQVVRLQDFQLTQVPAALKKLTFLKKLQICRSKWMFDQIVENLVDLQSLKQLFLSDNHFVEVDKTIKNLPPIEHLDLSGNDLVTISSKLKKLNSLDTLVLNRNSIVDLNLLAPVFQPSKISLLILQNDTVTNISDFEYLIPGKDVIWMYDSYNKIDFELPKGKTELVKEFETKDLKQEELSIESTFVKDVKLYSPAFIRFDQLQFPQALATLDTLTFNSRYKDSTYIYTTKIPYQNETIDGYYYPLKLDKAHQTYYKKKKKKKIDHEKLSHIRFQIHNSVKGFESKVLVSILVQPFEGSKSSELEAFKDVTWQMVDFLNNKEFEEAVMNQKTWSDIRIEKLPENEYYTFALKGRFQNLNLKALALKTTNLSDESFSKKSMPKIYQAYQKDLVKEAAKFDKDLKKSIVQAEKKFSKEIIDKWAKVQIYMSEDEKKLSRYEWMPYYLKIKGNEFGLIAQEKLQILYLSRYLESRGFISSKGNDFYVGQKWISFTLQSNKQELLKIEDYCLIDLDRRLIKYFPDQEKTEFLYDGYHNFVMIAKLSNGSFVLLDPEQMKLLSIKETLIVPEKYFIDKEKSNAAVAETIENMLKLLKY
jgi:Leucine-rich repeat (LRR) protein